jgi:hypothetical protein
MEPYCKVLPICYTPIQTSREFSVGQISCFNHSLNVIGSKESLVRESDVSLADYGTRFIIPGV